MKRKIRYQAAIRTGDHLLMEKINDRISLTRYWLLPGGGREDDETEEECLVREVREETSLSVQVGRLLLDEQADPQDETYQRLKTYACQMIAGEPRPGTEPEVDTPEHATIEALAWIDLRRPTTWDPLIVRDPITFHQLQRLRKIWGYAAASAAE
jgi:8-oxo-dGTP pyrophosphatase MutT (NUDIX family)